MPWVEKYRPRVLADVIGNEEAVKRLAVIAEEGNMPNLILSGPPGTGKTTSVLCLAHALLGPVFREGVLELNASDDRGIDVVRNKIKMFAQTKVTLPPGKHKVVILDEADSMTKAAQQALRRTMELYSSSTRFALACNNSTKIIEPIQSRCAILRYTKLTDEQVLRRVDEVCSLENVVRTDDGLEAIVFTAEGDMRHALNNLQATVAGFGVVNQPNVFKVCDQPHPLVVKEILLACSSAPDLPKALDMCGSLWMDGYSATDIVGTLFRVAKSLELSQHMKLDVIKEIGNYHMRIADGVATLLQIQALCSQVYLICNKGG